MLWKLISSDERVTRALEQSTDYDISPGVLSMPANNDAPPSRLWLEDYMAGDTEQTADTFNFWERTVYTR